MILFHTKRFKCRGRLGETMEELQLGGVLLWLAATLGA
jgi:hypothetical protein